MVSGMQMVAMGNVGMMSCLFMATADVMLGRFFVVAGCMFMMLRRFRMMFCACLAHREGIRIFLVQGFESVEPRSHSRGSQKGRQVTFSLQALQ